jgi:2-dehydro-3-deoxyphosphogluconate aldolase/(4S)-4-hydroxy-2-oxoglutarate aldolase
MFWKRFFIHAVEQTLLTPVLREDISQLLVTAVSLWSPGCGTLTEIARAEELGCEIVKLFPGDVTDLNLSKN